MSASKVVAKPVITPLKTGKVSPAEKLAAVKLYAAEKAATVPGWKFVAESVTDEELVPIIASYKTCTGAVKAVWAAASLPFLDARDSEKAGMAEDADPMAESVPSTEGTDSLAENV